MSMKVSRKIVIGVVIDLPKYFASHFGNVTLKQLITFISFTQKWGTFILQNVENVWALTRLVQLCLPNAAF